MFEATSERDPRMTMEIRQDGPLLLIEQERFDARFPADPADDLEQLQHQDFYVTVKGGPTYYASLMTLGAIDVVLRRWAETGEAASGRYTGSARPVRQQRLQPRPLGISCGALGWERTAAAIGQGLPDITDRYDEWAGSTRHLHAQGLTGLSLELESGCL